MNLHLADVPDGLTHRARSFVRAHGLRVGSLNVDKYQERWLDLGIPAAEVDRVAAFAKRWGGLALPPAPVYDGGPKILSPDTPDDSLGQGWWFEAGAQRTAIPYSFLIGPNDKFGIHGGSWVALHKTIEGWVESVALAHHASIWAKTVTKVTGDDVDALQLKAYEPVPEIAGLADTWWRGPGSLIAIYTGEAQCLSTPRSQTAIVYSGLDNWGLHG
ncbi:hypothetical protein ABIA35_009824 [Catenulispora sp. MAP12-49]|uniref:hypothetical protein n=1 Tax=unclassified Catenulispora TaxID=414885 RepID=UPI0035187332